MHMGTPLIFDTVDVPRFDREALFGTANRPSRREHICSIFGGVVACGSLRCRFCCAYVHLPRRGWRAAYRKLSNS